eukprot:2707942-Rhodomonas_salina.1
MEAIACILVSTAPINGGTASRHCICELRQTYVREAVPDADHARALCWAALDLREERYDGGKM